MPGAPRWTVFLDRDGVLNHKAPEGDYIRSAGEFVWLPGVLPALRRLAAGDVRVVVVTNQQGVAKGIIKDLDAIHARLRADVDAAGGRIDGIYVCPHLSGTCDCRKPAPGLFHQAQRAEPGIDFSRSVVVGDAPSDIEAGESIGARTIRITSRSAIADKTREAVSLADAVDRLILPWTRV